jgi:hypothetical protein
MKHAAFGKTEGWHQHGHQAIATATEQTGHAIPADVAEPSESTVDTATDTNSAEPTVETNSAPTSTFDATAISDLLYMIEEEKLAGDIYEAFYDLYGVKIFNNIAQSEDQHFSAVITQAENLGLNVDEFVFEPSGTFVNDELQALYDSLLATGSQSLTDALEVGVAIEEKDLVDIAAAADAVDGTVLADVYENLLMGSVNHLDAFENVLMG